MNTKRTATAIRKPVRPKPPARKPSRTTDRTDLPEVAGLLGVAEKTVRDWIIQGLPVLKLGTRGGAREKTELSLRAVLRWFAQHMGENRDRQRLLREKADGVAMANAQRRGELLERGDVEREQARILRAIDITLDTLPDVIERDCGATPAQIERMDRVIDGCRETLYQQLIQKDDPT